MNKTAKLSDPIPICLNFDYTKIIGFIQIDKKYTKQFIKQIISPAWIAKTNEIIQFGLMPYEAYNNQK